MATITNRQIRAIHTIARSLGMAEDVLHDLVYDLTAKNSIRELESGEAYRIISDLQLRQSGYLRKGKSNTRPGGASESQQLKVWALMYSLEAASPSNVPVGDRLCGVIRKELNITAFPKDPFAWLDFQMCSKLIDVLKRYVKNAEKKAKPATREGIADV